jgi:hypothetical protein
MNEFRSCCCSLPDMCGPQVCETCINNTNKQILPYTWPHTNEYTWVPGVRIKKEIKEYDEKGNLIRHEIEYYDTSQRYIIGTDSYKT